MKVLELLESRNDLLDKIRVITTQLVVDKIEQKSSLAQMYHGNDEKLKARLKKTSKADPDLKSSILYLSKSTDRFWSDSFHTMAESMLHDDDLDVFMEVTGEALYEIGDNVVEYYTNRWNHAPGFEPPHIEFEPDDVTDEEIKKAFSQVPEFNQLVERDEERKAIEKSRHAEKLANQIAKVTDLELTATGAFIDRTWDTHFGEKTILKLQKEFQKRPNGYLGDWFPEGAPKTADDMYRQMVPRNDGFYESRLQVILEWMSSYRPKNKTERRIEEIMDLGIRNVKFAEKIAAKSERLQEVLKRYGNS